MSNSPKVVRHLKIFENPIPFAGQFGLLIFHTGLTFTLHCEISPPELSNP